MSFSPNVHDIILIHGKKYQFIRNESTNLDIVDEREGGEGIVYRLASHDSPGQYFALKTFFGNLDTSFVNSISESTEKLTRYKSLKGLQVCDRQIIRSASDCPSADQYSELLNAILMPWISGYTWHDVVAGVFTNKPVISFNQHKCLILALNTAEVLAGLEKQELAHCDIASGNIIFAQNNGSSQVELVDVEDMFSNDFNEPPKKTHGSDGYRHPNIVNGIWYAEADRFAGAILLSEMLSWYDSAIRNSVNGDTYFSNNEMGQYVDKFEALHNVLASSYSLELADLFEAAWFSDSIKDCPSMGRWLDEIKKLESIDQPKLVVMPLELDFGILSAQQRGLSLVLSNEGKGSLTGTLSATDIPWITIEQRKFELREKEACSINVRAFRTGNLESGSLALGYLSIDTNGGQIDIPVSGKVEVAQIPQVQVPIIRRSQSPSTSSSTDEIAGICAILAFIAICIVIFTVIIANN